MPASQIQELPINTILYWFGFRLLPNPGSVPEQSHLRCLKLLRKHYIPTVLMTSFKSSIETRVEQSLAPRSRVKPKAILWCSGPHGTRTYMLSKNIPFPPLQASGSNGFYKQTNKNRLGVHPLIRTRFRNEYLVTSSMHFMFTFYLFWYFWASLDSGVVIWPHNLPKLLWYRY